MRKKNTSPSPKKDSAVQAEKDLRESEERFRTIAEFTYDWEYWMSPEGDYLYISPSCERITGYDRDEFMTDPGFLFRIVHPDDRDAVMLHYSESLPSHMSHEMEFRVITREGGIRWIGHACTPVFGPDGAYRGRRGSNRDITERRQAQEALKKHREDLELLVLERTAELNKTIAALEAQHRRFNDVLEQLPAYLVLLTPDYHVPFANRFFRERFGESHGRRCYEYLFQRSEPCEVCETYTVLKTMGPHEWEWTGPDGRNYQIFDLPFIDTDGSTLIMEMGIDVTERKRIELVLQQKENRLSEAQRIARMGNWELDLQSSRLEWSDEIYRIFELDPKEFDASYEAFLNAIHPEDRESVNRAYNESVGNKTPYDITHRLLMKDGRIKYVNERCETYYDGDGGPLRSAGTVQDITEHIQAEEKLNEASLYARNLIEASIDPMVTISPEGKITDVNAATEEVTGRPRAELIGKEFSDYFTEPEKAREVYKQVFAQGSVRDYPLAVRHVSGRVTDVLYNATVFRNSEGRIQGVFAAARDITGKKAAEAELEKYRLHLEELVNQRTGELENVNRKLLSEITQRRQVADELHRSNRDLEQFAYVASHDLQEPLRAISGFVSLLNIQLKNSLDSRSAEYMNFVMDGVTRMQTLINGLLEYSRIGTRGKSPEPVDVNAVLERVLPDLQPVIGESGVKIFVEPLPVVIFDPVQLQQLFQNLVSNAVKFRGESGPEIHISAERISDSWRFAVRDNGIGIEPAYTGKIFMIFQRLHTRNRYPGTGIGLALCKKIIERHGGSIWVESSPGLGSTFYFTIPFTDEVQS